MENIIPFELPDLAEEIAPDEDENEEDAEDEVEIEDLSMFNGYKVCETELLSFAFPNGRRLSKIRNTLSVCDLPTSSSEKTYQLYSASSYSIRMAISSPTISFSSFRATSK